MPDNDYDAIVVGSGPSGSTVARELSKQKKKVLILERGADAPLSGSFLSKRAIYNTVSVGDKLTTWSAYTTGGTTAVYFAVAGIPRISALTAAGIDISNELEETKRELPMSVLPDEFLGSQAFRVRQSALELGHSWQKCTMLVDLAKCRNGYSDDAKWRARTFLQQAVSSGATLMTRAKAQKVLIENGRAVGVQYEDGAAGKGAEARKVYASRVVLSAGAAATPVILRDSGLKRVLNQGFYCCPGFLMMGVVPGLKAGDSVVGSMSADLGDGVSLGDASLPRSLYRIYMLTNGHLLRSFQHASTVCVGVEARDGIGGGLQEDGRFHKTLSAHDIAKLDRGEAAARKIIENAGGRNLFRSRLRAIQLGGTVRIQEHLDANLETEIQRLHVCDGSVLPQSVTVPPTVSLVCLGRYLAKQIARMT